MGILMIISYRLIVSALQELVCLSKWPPWFFSNSTHRWGPMRNVADNLADSLGFTYSIEAPADGQWGVRTNGNWTGMVGMIHENRSDIALGPIALTQERTLVGDFSAQVITDYLTILSGFSSRPEPNAFGSLMAFDWTVWLTLLGALTVISCLSLVFEVVEANEVQKKINLLRRLTKHFDTYFRAIVAKSSEALPSGDSLRVLNQVWWFGMIVLMNAYTGHMKAMMMVKPEPIRINSMAELALHQIPVYVWRGTAYEALLRTSPVPEYARVYALVQKCNGAKSTDDLYKEEILHQILQARAVIVSNVVVMRYHVAQSCRSSMSFGSYHFATQDFFPHKFALVFTKSTPTVVKKRFDERIRWMVETGLMDRWLYSQYDDLDVCAVMAKYGLPVRTLDLEEIQSAFWVWIIGLAFSSISIICENLCLRRWGCGRTKKRSVKRPENLKKTQLKFRAAVSPYVDLNLILGYWQNEALLYKHLPPLRQRAVPTRSKTRKNVML